MGAAGLLLVLLVSSAQAQDWISLNDRFSRARDAGRLQEAAQIGNQLSESARGLAASDPQNAAALLHNIAGVYDDVGRYADAEALLLQALPLYERVLGPEHLEVAMTLNTLGVVNLHQSKLDEAEKLLKRALAIQESRAGEQSADVAYTVNNLALLQATRGDFRAAEPLYERALKIKRALYGREHKDVATALNNLASAYEARGKLQEAEELLRDSLAQRLKLLPAGHPEIANSYGNLGITCVKQGKLSEAEPLLKRAMLLKQEAGLGETLQAAYDLSYLGALYRAQTRYADAERMYRRALRIREQHLPTKHPLVVESRTDLASLLHQGGHVAESASLYASLVEQRDLSHDLRMKLLYNAGMLREQQKDFAGAAKAYEESLNLMEQLYGQDHPDRSKILGGLARMARFHGDHKTAMDRLNAAIELAERSPQSARDVFLLYQDRARLHHERGERTEARNDLQKALDLAAQHRTLASGDDSTRARSFAEFAQAYDLMISWQLDAGQTIDAILTADELRARSLADQLRWQGVDLLKDVPADQANAVRRRQYETEARVASLEAQLDHLNGVAAMTSEQRAERIQLENDLESARGSIAELYGEMCALSPVYRRAVGGEERKLDLGALQAWIDREQSIVLAYHFGQEGGHLAVLRPGAQPQVYQLTIDEPLATKLQTTPGPLNLERIQKAFYVGIHALPHKLSQPQQNAETVDRLADLAGLLLPPPVRGELTNKYRSCCVVPSGPLNLVPLECLVLEQPPQLKYVLDSSPPITYGPSLKILLQLAQEDQPALAGMHALTLGEPIYSNASSTSDSTAASRYGRASGRLSPLPYSGLESAWVAEVLSKGGMQSSRLIGKDASEVRLRQEIAGKQLVHLACHGLTDDAHGNLFGCLAVSTGSRQETAGDGFLTLPEIYQLDARSCEIAILSACRTNYGPEQRGEGTWTIARGFLVAGSRRVVASNWLVDDEAAASLISYFCSGIANGHRSDNLSYARSLQDAKRWVRGQEKWSSPYYWGSFVLIGPDR